VPEHHLRAPHILSLGFKDGMPPGLIEGLAIEGVYVAARLGRLRISPHVFNDEADCDRFVAALTQRLSEVATSPSPRSSRGEGWGEGLLPR